jgi:hypothetical protein
MQNWLASQLESVSTPRAGSGVSRTSLCFQNLDLNVFSLFYFYAFQGFLGNICESVSLNDLECYSLEMRMDTIIFTNKRYTISKFGYAHNLTAEKTYVDKRRNEQGRKWLVDIICCCWWNNPETKTLFISMFDVQVIRPLSQYYVLYMPINLDNFSL